MKHFYTSPKTVRIIQVIEVVFEAGLGEIPAEPRREIKRYYSSEGVVLAEHDPLDDEVFVSE